MISRLIQSAFEFLVTVVWERYGPLIGVLVGLGCLATIAGAFAFVINWLT